MSELKKLYTLSSPRVPNSQKILLISTAIITILFNYIETSMELEKRSYIFSDPTCPHCHISLLSANMTAVTIGTKFPKCTYLYIY